MHISPTSTSTQSQRPRPCIRPSVSVNSWCDSSWIVEYGENLTKLCVSTDTILPRRHPHSRHANEKNEGTYLGNKFHPLNVRFSITRSRLSSVNSARRIGMYPTYSRTSMSAQSHISHGWPNDAGTLSTIYGTMTLRMSAQNSGFHAREPSASKRRSRVRRAQSRPKRSLRGSVARDENLWGGGCVLVLKLRWL
jgi:hypothetical protein